MTSRRRCVGAARRSTPPASSVVLSEAFTGANGAAFGANWTNPRTTTGAIVSIQSNQGSLTSGTLGSYAGKCGIQTVATVTDFDFVADYIVVGTSECYPMIGFRSGTTWSTADAAATNTYWFEIERLQGNINFLKRVGDVRTQLTSPVAYTFTAGDVIHIGISALGSALKARVWKNAETEPLTWQLEITDASLTSGKVYLALNGGPSIVADEARFDNVSITVPSSNVSGSVARTLGAVTSASSDPMFVDILTLFRSTFPASGAEIWVDPAGNDASPGTSGSPKRTAQGAINIASAGSQIRLRAGTYNDGPFNWSGKNGTQSSWIQMRLEPGAIMQLAGGGGGQGLSQLQNCSFIAIYGGEWVGVNNVSNPYEVAHLMQFGAHSIAVWGGTYHDSGGHAFASLGGTARFDVCYNRMYNLCKWNEFQASAISCIGLADVGAAWPDGYHNHIIGNVIDATWTEPSRVPPWDPGGVFIPSDGNGVIWDVSGGYTGRSLAAKNLIVGCGGRALHALQVDNVDMYLNTCLDNSQNLAGSWIGEISITDSTGCHAAWNLCAARTGSNRVGIFQNPGTSTWSDTGFLRGTGGSESNDPSVNSSNNVDLTATGPTGYFVAYQQGVHTQVSITNIAGFRPKLAQVSKFTPSAALRTLMSSWPDALGVLPPATGQWARGAFEAA